jgi:peptide/nickel transport system substrate-binding protein
MIRTCRGPGAVSCAAIVTSALILLAGCSNGGGVAGGGHPVSGGTLTEIINADPGNLDPQSSAVDTDVQLSFYAYDRLVAVAGDGSIKPNLATSWTANAAGTKYVFTLHKGVTCSDGSALSPATVAANLNYVGNPKNASPLLGATMPPGTSASADAAADTVTVTLPTAAPFFLSDLNLLPIVCQKGLDDRASLAHTTDGTGPYVLSSAQSGNAYTYTLRKGYTWGPGGASTATAGMPATVRLEVVSNETTAANLLLGGSAQIAAVSGPDRSRLAGAGLFHTGSPETFGEMFFNQTSGDPGADQTVRRALTAGLDLPQVGTVITGGGGTAAQGLVAASPAPCPGNTVRGNVPGYDPSLAKELLDQDGWTVAAGGVRAKNGKKLSLTLFYPTGVGDGAAATELIQQEWRQIGVQTTLEGRPESQINSVLFGTGAWDASLVPVGVSNPAQAVPFLTGPTPPNGDNFAHIDDTAYQSTVAQAETRSGTAGCGLWNQAEESLLRAVDVVPFEDALVETWGKSATFTTVNSVVLPTSLRLLG